MAKAIKGSVGSGGANHPADVFTVQYLLNLVPKSQGGPSPELAVDAICGPLTRAAILKFQMACGAPCDSRIDPGGPTLGRLQSFDPYPMQNLSAAMAGKLGKAGSAAQKAAAEVIVRMIGESLAKQHGKWIGGMMGPGKHLPMHPGAIPGLAKGIADVVLKATQAAAKVVEQAAKQGGLPVGPNPFGPPPAAKLEDVIRKAFEAAQKVAEQTAKQAGKSPGAPFFNPIPQVAESAAKAAQSITNAAIKAAEAVAKLGKIPPSPAPSIQSPISELNSKLAGAIKLATDSAARAVEEAAKAAAKATSNFG